jgi:uncharacterized protein
MVSTAENADPTMEEILASIRRIIEDEQDGSEPKPKVKAIEPEKRPEPEIVFADDAVEDSEEEEPMELGAAHAADPPAQEVAMEEPAMDVLELADVAQPVAPLPPEKLVSDSVEGLATSQLSQLSGLLVRGYPGSENTLEGLVRDMLRPMLKDWLDKNLPDLVEQMVAREIARISGRAR